MNKLDKETYILDAITPGVIFHVAWSNLLRRTVEFTDPAVIEDLYQSYSKVIDYVDDHEREDLEETFFDNIADYSEGVLSNSQIRKLSVQLQVLYDAAIIRETEMLEAKGLTEEDFVKLSV